MLRSRRTPDADPTCSHLALAATHPDPAPVTPGVCEDCVREGTQWVHLRLCLDCGHLACCDSSPMRHATAHNAASTHPVMRSAEDGESWRWCFPDQLLG